jgi:predicted RecA/RadA family phage recombinase
MTTPAHPHGHGPAHEPAHKEPHEDKPTGHAAVEPRADGPPVVTPFVGPGPVPIAVYLQEGERIDYTPVADVKAGDVIDLGTFVGIATSAIPANTLGSLVVEGVFDVAKRAGTAAALGDKIYWSVSGLTASNNGTYNDAIMGYAVQPAAAADQTLRVKLWPNFA